MLIRFNPSSFRVFSESRKTAVNFSVLFVAKHDSYSVGNQNCILFYSKFNEESNKLSSNSPT